MSEINAFRSTQMSTKSSGECFCGVRATSWSGDEEESRAMTQAAMAVHKARMHAQTSPPERKPFEPSE